MRQRIEDLGRIAVLLDNIMDMDIWEEYRGRKKEFVDYFYNLTKEDQSDLLHKIIYSLESMKERLYDIRAIAHGQDPLNDVFPE